MDQLEVIFEEFRNAMKQMMIEEGIELTREEQIEFYKDLIKEFTAAEDQPVLIKRMLVVIIEYEIELLETMPPVQ